MIAYLPPQKQHEKIKENIQIMIVGCSSYFYNNNGVCSTVAQTKRSSSSKHSHKKIPIPPSTR